MSKNGSKYPESYLITPKKKKKNLYEIKMFLRVIVFELNLTLE